MKVIVNGVTKELVIKPGHKCYKLKVTHDDMQISVVTDIEHADGLYCSALNMPNAIKKFENMLKASLIIHNNKK
jgi:hypothetical protein